jgi:hypothetical protein
VGLAGLVLALPVLTAASTGCDESQSPAAAASTRIQSCPVTLPSRDFRRDGFNHGDRFLAVALWPKGRLVAGPLADGSSYAEVNPDGSVTAKLGWIRHAPGRLKIDGERLDAPAPPLRAHVPDGYGNTGFQATGLMFPTQGCWKIEGRVGEHELPFVVLVTRP